LDLPISMGVGGGERGEQVDSGGDVVVVEGGLAAKEGSGGSGRSCVKSVGASVAMVCETRFGDAGVRGTSFLLI
jgi:hypothetical protein